MSNAPTALQCAGWLTPPQSAHESHRPSMAYPSYSEMQYSTASTATAFSLPSTPSRSVQGRSNHAAQSFANEHIHFDLAVPLSEHQHDMADLGLDAQANCNLDPNAMWSGGSLASNSSEEFHGHFDSEHTDSLWQVQDPSNGFIHQPAGLQATLFPVTHGMAATPQIISPTYSLDSNAADFPAFHYNPLPQACYQSPGIVEPSLVNPHNGYGDHNYSMLGSPGSSPQDLSTSFGSDLSSSWADVHTPGQDMDCCEDIDGFLHVGKEEDIETSPTSTIDYKPIKPRLAGRRASKRTRKVQSVRQVANIRGTEIELQLEGEGIGFEGNRFVYIDHSVKKKTFVCIAPDSDGNPCNAAFVRGEHLKRHVGKHSLIRRFPCVLPGCDKKIGRSDNACDHFRTHLALHGRNKRNDHFHWREVERRIRWAYKEKTAGKIIVNLERWLAKQYLASDELREAQRDDRWQRDERPFRSAEWNK
jgi:hypothetical protein